VIDRGPDSVATVEIIRHLVEAGVAQMILGNHELNVLERLEKEGNGWIEEHTLRPDGWFDRGVRVDFASRQATAQEQAEIRSFFATLPLVLESDALRVVHAAWDTAAIAAARDAPDLASFLALRSEPAETHALADAPTSEALADPEVPVSFHPELARRLLLEQNGRPAKVITSGRERCIPDGTAPRFTGGKWRMLERDAWWEHDGDERKVVFGHYWRRRPGAKGDGRTEALSGIPPLAWFGDRDQAFCVDYSVGSRFKARHRSTDPHRNCALGALRFPECTVVFDDDPKPIATLQP
jgi:hypothetical protein